LNLWGCGLGDTRAALLFPGLKDNQGLKELDLGNNTLASRGVDYLQQALASNKRLKGNVSLALNLRGCGIDHLLGGAIVDSALPQDKTERQDEEASRGTPRRRQAEQEGRHVLCL